MSRKDVCDMTVIYRFRPIDYLLDKHHELEKQELVLSSPQHLNDPIEGYQDVFWEGDNILWENLLRHYLLNLYWATRNCALYDDDTFKEDAIRPKLTRDDLPTDDFRQQFDSVCQSFFDEKEFEKVPSRLASLPKPLKRNALQLVLLFMHRPALASVVDTLRTSSTIPEMWPGVTNQTDSDAVVENLDGLSAAMADDAEASWIESAASIVRPLMSHTVLQRALENKADEVRLARKKEIFLYALFPAQYVKQICDSLIHPNWHTLCFSKECTSPSMWAAYADEHQGAALMFRTDSQSEGPWAKLEVKKQIGLNGSGPIYDQIQAPLYTVDYESPPPEVDFFRFLGTLPRPKLVSAWHSTPDGETSPLVDEISEDEDSWRENLRDHFHSMTTRKLGQWEHEEEIRMVLSDYLGSGSHRTVTYDLSQLAGVVFGLRTRLEDRFKVMRILAENSQDGDSPPVKFYQMVFDGTSFRKVELAI